MSRPDTSSFYDKNNKLVDFDIEHCKNKFLVIKGTPNSDSNKDWLVSLKISDLARVSVEY